MLGGVQPFGDILETEHRTDHLSGFQNRRHAVGDGKMAAVPIQQQAAFPPADDAVLQHPIQRAVLGRQPDAVQRSADQLFFIEPQHGGRGRIGEGNPAFRIQAQDTFADGFQNQLLAMLQAGDLFLRQLALGQILDDTGKQAAIAQTDFAHRQIHRKGATVLTPTDDFPADADDLAYPGLR